MAVTPASAAVSLSTRLYRLLLVAYPRRFRREYGDPMRQVFRDCCREAERRGGARAVILLWVLTLRDLITTALVERVTEVVRMSSTNWVRWSGVAAILGGALWMVGLPGLGEKLPRVSHAGGHMILSACALFLLFGLAGAYARYAGRAGLVGKTSLGIGLLGAVLVIIGNALEGLFEIELGWGLFMLGMLALLICMVVFGAAARRAQLLPSWTVWPFFISALTLLLLLLSSMLFSINLGTTPYYVNIVSFSALIMFGLGWMALGLALWLGTRAGTAPPPLAAV